ncbi:HD domain-containing protein [Butyrivibrio sp. INlla16]|nr:HD domain-containing protein [Butyrivibrio sp. INlla16]
MYPSIDIATNELNIASELNPGPWILHSKNTGIAARNIAEKVQGMNPEKAYVIVLLHDIGRRVGIVGITRHVYEGYKYCIQKEWDEVAQICMTHSYIHGSASLGQSIESDEEKAIKEYLDSHKMDDYDRLIQLCDALATDYGFVILEKRFVDVVRRYGIVETYIGGWEKTFEIKEYFEDKMGCSIYDVLPEIEKTTLICPNPWRPK